MAREYNLEINEISATLTSIEKVLDLPKLEAEAVELEAAAGVPNLWDDPEKAQVVTSKLSRVQGTISRLKGLRRRVDDLGHDRRRALPLVCLDGGARGVRGDSFRAAFPSSGLPAGQDYRARASGRLRGRSLGRASPVVRADRERVAAGDGRGGGADPGQGAEAARILR